MGGGRVHTHKKLRQGIFSGFFSGVWGGRVGVDHSKVVAKCPEVQSSGGFAQRSCRLRVMGNGAEGLGEGGERSSACPPGQTPLCCGRDSQRPRLAVGRSAGRPTQGPCLISSLTSSRDNLLGASFKTRGEGREGVWVPPHLFQEQRLVLILQQNSTNLGN